jgi:DNA-binding HxlR family transcriptional regulator
LRRTRFDTWPCPIARATDLVGDWWTPIVLRNAFLGQRRFDEMQASLGVPRAILARRLDRLVREGLLRRERYSEHPPRYEYRLTEKGRAFWDVLAALWRWGEDWLWEAGEPPVVLVDRESGRRVRPLVVDEATGQRLDVRRLRVCAAAGRRAPGHAASGGGGKSGPPPADVTEAPRRRARSRPQVR